MGQRDISAGKDAWWPEFILWDLHGGRKETTSTSYALIFTLSHGSHIYIHILYAYIHTYTHTIKKKRKTMPGHFHAQRDIEHVLIGRHKQCMICVVIAEFQINTSSLFMPKTGILLKSTPLKCWYWMSYFLMCKDACDRSSYHQIQIGEAKVNHGFREITSKPKHRWVL